MIYYSFKYLLFSDDINAIKVINKNIFILFIEFDIK